MTSPPTPQRKGSLRSRVGGALRRTPTVFSIPGLPNRGNSATPPPAQDSDTSSIAGSVSGKLDRQGSSTSLNKIDTTPPPAHVTVSSAPSPIPESPAREAAAMAAEPQPVPAKVSSPSPLANEVLTAEAASERGPTPPQSVSGTPPTSESVPATSTPPPQPPAVTQRQPSQTSSTVVVDEARASKTRIAPVLTAEPEEIAAPQAGAPSAPSHPSSKSATPPPPASVPATPAALSTTSTGYFGDIPRSTTPIGLESDPDTNVWADHRGGASESGSEAPRGRALTNRPSKSSLRPSSAASSQVAPQQPQSRNVSRKASGVIVSRQTELADVTKTWSNSSDLGLGSKTHLP